jgi:hypothetical protein
MASALLTLADLPPRPSTAQATPDEGTPVRRSPSLGDLARPASSAFVSNNPDFPRWPAAVSARHSSLTAATLPMQNPRKLPLHASKTSSSSLPLPGQPSPRHSPPSTAASNTNPNPGPNAVGAAGAGAGAGAAPQTMMLPLRGVGGVRQRVAIHSPSSSAGSSPVPGNAYAFPRMSIGGDKDLADRTPRRSIDSTSSSTRRRPSADGDGAGSIRAMSPVPANRDTASANNLKATPTLGYSGLGQFFFSLLGIYPLFRSEKKAFPSCRT